MQNQGDISVHFSTRLSHHHHQTYFPCLQTAVPLKCTDSYQGRAPQSPSMASSSRHPSTCVWWTEYCTASPTTTSLMAGWWRPWSWIETQTLRVRIRPVKQKIWMMTPGKGRRACHHRPYLYVLKRCGGVMTPANTCSLLCARPRAPFPWAAFLF